MTTYCLVFVRRRSGLIHWHLMIFVSESVLSMGTAALSTTVIDVVLPFDPPRPVCKAAHMISQEISLEILRHALRLNPGHKLRDGQTVR